MKNGPNEFDDKNPKKKLKGSKELVDLFYKISVGNYEDFRRYLKQNNVEKLYLKDLECAANLFFSSEGRFNQHTYRHGKLISPIKTFKEYVCLFFDHLHYALQGTTVAKIDAKGLSLKYEAATLLSALNGTPVKKVNLSENGITCKHMVVIGPALNNNSITHLNLDDNEIGPEGVRYLGQGLRGSQIKSIKISRNLISDAGAIEIGAALKDTNVEFIDIGENEIEEDGAIAFAQALKDTKVSKLFIDGNWIRPSGASSFAHALVDSKVTMVNASGNNLQSDGALYFVEGLQGSGVKDLRLRYNNIYNSYAKKIAVALLDTVVTFINIDCDIYEDELIEDDETELSITHETQLEIEKSLQMNKEKLVLPYYAAALRLLPPEVKGLYLNLPALDKSPTEDSKAQYGGGILMATNLPSDILAHTLSFLPAMNKRKAEKFIKLSADNHPNGLMSEIKLNQP